MKKPHQIFLLCGISMTCVHVGISMTCVHVYMYVHACTEDPLGTQTPLWTTHHWKWLGNTEKALELLNELVQLVCKLRVLALSTIRVTYMHTYTSINFKTTFGKQAQYVQCQALSNASLHSDNMKPLMFVHTIKSGLSRSTVVLLT